MASTVWKGHLTFGLVSMPVRLVRAARAERIKLRQLYRPAPAVSTEKARHAGSGLETPAPRILRREPESAPPEMPPDAEYAPPQPVAPVRRSYQAPDRGEIAASELAKGYEYEKGHYVVLEEDDLRALAPQTSTEIQVVEFVRFQEIDPVYLETSYYVVPDENAEKAYALLLEAMRQTGYAAVGQLTMHRRDHVIILRPGKTGLVGHTMFYPEEVRATEEFRTDTSLASAKELELAKSLIQALAQPFDPARFKNTFQERLRELIETRIEGRQTARVEPRAPAPVIDIMDALKRSLAQAKAVSKQADAEPATRKSAKSEGGQRKTRSTTKR
ncbi:MAG TPA: Ku protein [Bryobacteraceae bacterium]|nr:Ku protein [Bryobacteraceae bacterium]